VLANVHHDAELLLQDHFAPLVSMVSVESDERAVELTNNHELGLGASIFTGDDRNADRVAAALNVGVVCINDLIIPTADPRLPLSGRKQSGFGSTQGAEGLLEMTVPKVISVNKKKLRRAFARIRENDGELIAAFARLKHLRGIAPRLAAMQTMIDQLRKYTSPDR
jgi:acyl-CoA reductase-like NAD-dependent aldehyde dehydrogenase